MSALRKTCKALCHQHLINPEACVQSYMLKKKNLAGSRLTCFGMLSLRSRGSQVKLQPPRVLLLLVLLVLLLLLLLLLVLFRCCCLTFIDVQSACSGSGLLRAAAQVCWPLQGRCLSSLGSCNRHKSLQSHELYFLAFGCATTGSFNPELPPEPLGHLCRCKASCLLCFQFEGRHTHTRTHTHTLIHSHTHTHTHSYTSH